MTEEKSWQKTIKRLNDLPSFIKYLRGTNDSEWQVDTVRSKNDKKNCVMGHLVNWFYGKDYEGNITEAWDLFEEMWATTYMIYPVNDGNTPEWMNRKYNQSTPKERVIAYLKNLSEGKEKTTQVLMKESEEIGKIGKI